MSATAAFRQRRAPGRLILVTALLALTACRAGASDRGPNASALGAPPSGLLKAAPSSAASSGAAKATDPGPIALSGQGNDPGRAVTLGDGLTIFRVVHRGLGPFRVALLDVQGEEIDRLALGQGDYNGSRTVELDPLDVRGFYRTFCRNGAEKAQVNQRLVDKGGRGGRGRKGHHDI